MVASTKIDGMKGNWRRRLTFNGETSNIEDHSDFVREIKELLERSAYRSADWALTYSKIMRECYPNEKSELAESVNF